MKTIILALLLACGSAAWAADTGPLYEKKDKTLSTVFDDFIASLSAAPLVAGSAAFLSVPEMSGSCPPMTVRVELLQTDISLGQFFCDGVFAGAISAAGYALVILAIYFAFRVAFL